MATTKAKTKNEESASDEGEDGGSEDGEGGDEEGGDGEGRGEGDVKRFRVLLERHVTSEATGIVIPFDVPKVFGTRARVPVRGTINGYAFRGSIFPVGDGTHYMVVRKELREAAGVRGGQTIAVTLERDDEPRTVTPPADLARALKITRTRAPPGTNSATRTGASTPNSSKARSGPRRAPAASRRRCRNSPPGRKSCTTSRNFDR